MYKYIDKSNKGNIKDATSSKDKILLHIKVVSALILSYSIAEIGVLAQFRMYLIASLNNSLTIIPLHIIAIGITKESID